MIKRIMRKFFLIPASTLRLNILATLRSSALLLLCFLLFSQNVFSQNPPPVGGGRGATYCNPINIDYGYTPIPNFSEWGRHRATAYPVIVLYKNDYYLFSI